MKMNWTLSAAFLILALSLTVFGADPAQKPAQPAAQSPALDAHSQKALVETQQLLTNPAARDAEIKKDPNAQKWDANAAQAVGAGQKDQLYGVASDIMGDLVRQTGGDPKKMLELMERAKANPEAFFNSLTPEQKAKITDMSSRAPAAPQAAPVPK